MADLILKNTNPFAETFQSQRHKFFASAAFILKENANVLLHYAKDFPLLSSNDFDDIKIGEGKIIEIDQEKLAVTRDKENNLHTLSAVCPHMKCIVNWNDAEKTWDCPCHGSRFTCEGKIIEGPATSNLERKPLKK